MSMLYRKKISPFDVIITPLISKLNITGCNPEKRTHFIWNLLVIFFSAWIILTFVHMSKNSDAEHIQETITNLGGLLQIITGLLLIRIYKSTYVEMWNTMRTSFWFDESDIDGATFKKHKHYYKMLAKVIPIHLSIFWITLLFFNIEPLFANGRRFPMEITFPYKNFIKDSPFYETIYVAYSILLCLVVVCVVAISDLLYIMSMIFVLIQIQILKQNLRNIGNEVDDETRIYKKIARCVSHHNIILSVLKNIDEAYRYALLNKFVPDICIASAYLFSLEKNLNIRQICIMSITFLQPFLYCLFGDFVTQQCESIGMVAYNVKWEALCMKSVTNGLSMMILRAQKPMYMTIGKMSVLSLQTYVAMVKTIFSYYVVLKNMDNTH